MARDDGCDGEDNTDGPTVDTVVVLTLLVAADVTAGLLACSAVLVPAAGDAVDDMTPCGCWAEVLVLSRTLESLALDGAGGEP